MENVILNIVYLMFPLILYIIYLVYSNSMDKKANNLFLSFLLFTSFYFLIRFGSEEFNCFPFLFIHVPLFISYLEKNKLSVLLLSVCMLFYLKSFYIPIYILIMLLFLIYILFSRFYYKFKNKEYFIIFISVFYASFISIIFLLENINLWVNILYFILSIGFSSFLIIFFTKCSYFTNLHDTLKNIQYEKDVRLSIFKISHEIKNPIAVCKGYLDMYDPTNSEHTTKYISIVRSEIDRTLCLLKDFLDLNNIKVEKDEMDFNLLLEELENSCLPLLKDKKIKYDCVISDDDIYLCGDFNRLKQVFINFIKNSIEALDGIDNPYIKISYFIKGKYLHVLVSDNGCGMSKDSLDRIKEPFFTTKGNGTGLGVTISNEVIRAHGGKIEYSSILNEGTCVEIFLPIEKDS